MTIAISLLLVCFVIAVAFAAYQFSAANRWRQTAAQAREENQRQRAELEQANRTAIQQAAESAGNRELAEAQWKLVTQAQQQLEDKFRALASEALQSNSQLLLDRSRDQLQHMVAPVSESLRKFEQQVQAIEKSRVGAYESISAQVSALTQLQERVRQSTDQLKTALRSPVQRGRWGEMQLRRVVELAGMLEYCDFAEQKTLFGETNQRPDLIVRLPNHCQVVVDAKVSLEAYLRAIEAPEDADRLRNLSDHARQIRTHVKALGEKAYWERLPCSPEFVVAFLPLESLFSAALESDPALLDFAVERRVLIATPMTLITLLLTVAHGWREQATVENLEKIRSTGQELYGRLLTMSHHFSKLGDAVEKTVQAYNQTVGSLERNVLPSARKFKDLRPANAEQLEEVTELDIAPRALDSSKWKVLEAAKQA
ncbi:MAG TPA: DNA recombination protein RmuC [Bryobacteraceae bacterium]|nr:DNA recombination protein RmuC [Bryobacteraceae bacterium]